MTETNRVIAVHVLKLRQKRREILDRLTSTEWDWAEAEMIPGNRFDAEVLKLKADDLFQQLDRIEATLAALEADIAVEDI